MSKIVKAGRRGHYLVVQPPCTELIGAFLTTAHDFHHGLRAVPFDMIWEDKHPYLGPYQQSFAGMAELVREHLVRCGYVLEDDSDPVRNLPPPQLMRNDGQRRPDRGLLEHLRSAERALVRYPRGKVSLPALVAQIALAWPRERVAIAATRRADAKRIADHLLPLMPVTLMPSEGVTDDVERVVVGRPRGLACSGAAGLHEPGILIATNPHELFQEWGINLIKRARPRRLIGLLDANLEVAPYVRDFLLALFGPDSPLVPRHGALILCPQIVFLRIKGGPKIWVGTPLDLKQYGVWHHRIRNRRVVQLVKALIARNRPTMSRLFPDVLRALPKPPERVVVLVEVIEHALALLRRLPGARLVTGPDLYVEGLDSADASSISQACSRPSSCAVQIATAAGMRRLQRVDVLVAATGGPSLPLSLWEIGVSRSDKAPLIVDFNDRCHPELRSLSRQRLAHYLAEGCRIEGVRSPATALDHFLWTRRWRNQ